ncbi:Holliday junction resolvase RuvX [Muribaculaceae bacterium Isolate-104 (HZI)]|nr:Holliday junction resolvase RuvX [Muribaculaceae bacterium Isolate-104 (HZI)]
MGRLLAIDYGRRRCGIAVTDSLRIVATGMPTVATSELVAFVKSYVAKESVDAIIVGLPKDMHGNESDSMRYIRPGIGVLKKELPGMEIVFWDERFTSVMAHRSMLDSGMKKMQRREKGVADEMAAVIILNSYLESRNYNNR